MGTSYDAVVVYGLCYVNDAGEGWPEATLDAAQHDLGEAFDRYAGFDLDEWLDKVLGVPETEDYTARTAARRAACTARYGVQGFDATWAGHLDYPAWVVYVEGSDTRDWRMVEVPTATHTPTEEVALRRLAEDLPGSEGGPKLWALCRVG